MGCRCCHVVVVIVAAVVGCRRCHVVVASVAVAVSSWVLLVC